MRVRQVGACRGTSRQSQAPLKHALQHAKPIDIRKLSSTIIDLQMKVAERQSSCGRPMSLSLGGQMGGIDKDRCGSFECLLLPHSGKAQFLQRTSALRPSPLGLGVMLHLA